MTEPPVTTIIKNRLRNPDGSPRTGVKVELIVRGSSTWDVDGTGRILGHLTTWTNGDGCWREAVLPYTAYMYGKYVYVEVREGDELTGYIQVHPKPEGGEWWISDWLIDPPTPPGPRPIIAELASLHDVDRQSVVDAPDGAVLLKRGGMWRAEVPTLRTLSDIDPSVQWAVYDDPLVYLGDNNWGTHQFAPLDVRYGLVDPHDHYRLWFEGVQFSPGYEVEYRTTGMSGYQRWGDPATRLEHTFAADGTYLVQVRYVGIDPQQQQNTEWVVQITVPYEESA